MVSWVVGFILATRQPWGSSDVAAWIQAVFSVIAIGAAIWISHSQRRHDERSEVAEQRKSIVGILVLIERGRAITEAMAGIDVGNPSPAMLHSVRIIADKLESLELIVSPSPTLLRCSLHAANYLRVSIDRASEGRYAGMHGLVSSLQKSHDQISTFYGITEADYPAKPDW
jgi:hypothetical protein